MQHQAWQHPARTPSTSHAADQHHLRRLRRAGLLVPDQVIGLAWTGRINAERMRAALAALPPGLTEIYTHPATGSYPGAAPDYLYEEELAALTASLAIAAIQDKRFAHGHFRHFLPAARIPDAPPP